MADFRSLNPYKKRLITPKISTFRVRKQDKGGFKNEIFWQYPADSSVRVFRVYRAKVGAALTKREYKIDELTLQRLTSKISPVSTKLLYDKDKFVQNSKLKILNTSKGRYEQKEKDPTTYNFKQVGTVIADRSGTYKYTDTAVKFGQSYAYAISGIGDFFRETDESQPVIVTTEIIEETPEPSDLKLSPVPGGILMTMWSKNGSQIREFEIYKRNSVTQKFEYLDTVSKKENSNIVSYIDAPERLRERLVYRVYSVDLFGKKSLTSKEASIFYSPISNKPEGDPPQVQISQDSTAIKIEVNKDPAAFGFKVERRDVWIHEQGFSRKTKNGETWQGVFSFSKDSDSEVFFDTAVKRGRIYQYRITLVSKMGLDISYYISPIFRYGDEESFKSREFLEESARESEDPKIESFNVRIRDKKRRPQLIEMNWHISGGAWSHLVIHYNEESFVVDSIHDKIYSTKFKPGRKYILKVDLFDEDKELKDSREGIVVNT